MTDNYESGGQLEPWIRHKPARESFVRTLSLLYGILIALFAIVLEWIPRGQHGIWLVDLIFRSLFYGVGIAFLCYFCYSHYSSRPGQDDDIDEKTSVQPTTTVYLRIGAFFFGCLGVIQFGFNTASCLRSEKCNAEAVVQDVFAAVFTVLQTIFIVFSISVVTRCPPNVAKFGFMHLVAIDLWTAFRFVREKQDVKAFTRLHPDAFDDPDDLVYVNDVPSTEYPLTSTTVEQHFLANIETVLDFGEVVHFTMSCMVEYSLICLVVMYLNWKSIDSVGKSIASHGDRPLLATLRAVNRPTPSAVVGVFTTLVGVCSMALFSVFGSQKPALGLTALGLGYTTFFVTAITSCIIAFKRTFDLKYNEGGGGEMIDQFLLVVGLVGEVVYCVIGIIVSIDDSREHKFALFPLTVFILRLAQVIFQAVLIQTLSKLKCDSAKPEEHLCLRMVRLLMGVNLSLFVFQNFEECRTLFGLTVQPAYSYMPVINATAPFLVFYRFHSTLCFAEIWQNTFSSPMPSRTFTIHLPKPPPTPTTTSAQIEDSPGQPPLFKITSV